jgi:hemolysin-activating ACP:hemolysin acyltransferase
MGREFGKSSQSGNQAEVGEEPAAVNGTDTATANRPTGDPKRAELTSEARAKLAEIRSRIETSVGQVVLQMMQLPRYRHQTLGDLNHLVVEPLLRDRVAIAYAKGEGEPPATSLAPVGVAIWASVSDDVHAKIQEQVRAGVFPLRLDSEDWASGERLWLLDIVALNQKAASVVLVNFRNIAGDRQVQLHPLIARTVDPKILEQLRQPRSDS